MDQIFKRTSIRRYLDQPVEAEKTEYLLKAAMQAISSHGNSTSSRTGISWKNSPRSALMQGLPQGHL
ncbi:nitroreductase family protein [uncultured Dialister sp.]|jgi:nitroreductase|uniref:nitroreductase family protein n=1 Tax=uncultured Dialister sp. TaxID=278064 RepID=UPI00349FAA44